MKHNLSYSFLAKHPTTGNAIQSPYAAMSQNFMFQINRLWIEIYQIFKKTEPGSTAERAPG